MATSIYPKVVFWRIMMGKNPSQIDYEDNNIKYVIKRLDNYILKELLLIAVEE